MIQIIIAFLIAISFLIWLLLSRRSIRMEIPRFKLSVDLPNGRVVFNVIWMRFVSRNVWSTFFVTLQSGEEASAALRKEVKRRLAGDPTAYASRSGEAMIEEGAELTIVPEAEGVMFNPPLTRLRRLEPMHIAEFRMIVTSDASSVVGNVSFFIGPLLVADVPFEITVGVASPDHPHRRSSATPYRSIFVSYAHADAEIVEQLEKAYLAIGDSYLRDVKLLRSGERWSTALLNAIPNADVFQLCWSDAARSSAHVEEEWRCALGLRRMQFIRPVYWRKPLPLPPAELEDLHFTYIPLNERTANRLPTAP